MKVVPVGPGQITANTKGAANARERAMNAYMGANSEAQAAPAPTPQSPKFAPAVPYKPEVEEAPIEETPVEAMAAVLEEEPIAEEPKPEEIQQDPALSKQFAQLARQERQLRQKVQLQEQQFKAREDALKAREDALGAKDQEYKSGYISKDRLKRDALSVLTEAGVSYDELTNQIINQAPTDPRVQSTIDRLEAKIAELETDSKSTKKSYEDQQTQAYQAAVKQIESDVKKLVYTDIAFETIKHAGATKDVVELITETYNTDGILLSVEEAAQQVEDYLVEEAMKLAKLDKIQKRLQPSAKVETAPAKQTPAATAQKQTQMKTLTNANSGTPRKMSARDRAMAAFKGESF